MSWLGDNLGFEKFQIKDWLKKIGKNPEQLLLGAADPLGAKVWGGITGKEYEPFVDQMGGPYGGHAISAFGNNNGGVYGRAEDAGINTKPASQMHDAAHVIAASFAGNYLNGQMPGGGEGGQGGWQKYARMGMQQQPAQAPGTEDEQKRQMIAAALTRQDPQMAPGGMTPGTQPTQPTSIQLPQLTSQYPSGLLGLGAPYARRY